MKKFLDLLKMSQGVRWAFNVKEWIPTELQWKHCVKCIQKEESDRCNRFYFADDCKSSLIGRLLMRKAASESVTVQYDKIKFERTDSCKPYLSGEKESNFYFNVSHNGEFCVLASEFYVSIGVDVMKIEYRSDKPLSSYFETMRRQFSSTEWNFMSLPGLEKEQLARFFRLWCLKESYVKAEGTGISYDLSRLSFSCKTPSLKCGEVVTDTKLYKDNICQKDWKFEESLLDNDHCVAVAVKVNQKTEESNISSYYPKKFQLLNYEELMKNSIPFEEVDEETSWKDFTSKKQK